MDNKNKIELFAQIISDNWYFSSERCEKVNHIEWSDDRSMVTIYNDDPFCISGVGDIGEAAEMLDLCCTAYFDFHDRRLEIRVH